MIKAKKVMPFESILGDKQKNSCLVLERKQTNAGHNNITYNMWDNSTRCIRWSGCWLHGRQSLLDQVMFAAQYSLLVVLRQNRICVRTGMGGPHNCNFSIILKIKTIRSVILLTNEITYETQFCVYDMASDARYKYRDIC